MSTLTCPGCGATLNGEIALSLATSNGQGCDKRKLLLVVLAILLMTAGLCATLYLRW